MKNGELLEWAIVHTDLYGTPKQAVLQALTQGKNVIMDIDVQGAAQIKAKIPAVLLIFITAESAAEVKRRIFASSKMTTEQKENRWQSAIKELQAQTNYDYMVINHIGKLKQAVSEVKLIIKKELAHGA